MSSEAGSGSDPLDVANQLFHDGYSAARDEVREQVPILVLLPSELVLHRHSERHGVSYSRPRFAQAKSAAHIAVALFAITCTQEGQSGAGVAQLIGHIAAALNAPRPSDEVPIDTEIRDLLSCCLNFANAAHERRASEQARAAFASDAGPRVLRITELATCEQIAGLHAAVDALLSLLSAGDRAKLQVVVVGDHQARARSLGMQYFKRRFQEEPGADERITYGENITDEAEAIALVATRRLDKRIAKAFFGDENRLQRDVLGDAAKRCLDSMGFPA
ncbi:MAG: hypothetical protein ABIQ16_21065 [Polyangiaceae bacterium]